MKIWRRRLPSCSSSSLSSDRALCLKAHTREYHDVEIISMHTTRGIFCTLKLSFYWICCDSWGQGTISDHLSHNCEDGAWLDVVAQYFWGLNRQHAFFDLRVFNPFASCYSWSPLLQEKRYAYDERVKEVEKACFSPLLFSASDSMGSSATPVYKKLASMLADKICVMNYSRCLFWIKCRVCFSLLKYAILCWGDIVLLCVIHLQLKLIWPVLRVGWMQMPSHNLLVLVLSSCPALWQLGLGVVASYWWQGHSI